MLTKEQFARMSGTYRMLLKAGFHREVAAPIAAVFLWYPANSKGKWLLGYEKMWDRMDKKQRAGFALRKLNAIAGREQIPHSLKISSSPLSKMEEKECQQAWAASLENSQRDIESFGKWQAWRATNRARYIAQNERITCLCALLLDKQKKRQKNLTANY